MPIAVQTIVDRCASALDAEGFDRYQFDLDYMPAINYAKEWIVSAFNKAFSQTKLSEESLRELVKVRIFRASIYSRVNFNSTITGDRIWSVFAVYPETEYAGTLGAIPTTTSVYCPLASYTKSYKSAKRGTLEEVNRNRLNPFVDGNEVNVCAETRNYLYTFAVDYNGSYTSTPTFELEVYPSISTQPVAIAYLVFPEDIDDITDYIPFPEAMTNIVVNKTLEWIAYKQGDNTTLKAVTDEDVNTLISLMI